jgi:hypothetical protein
MKPVGLLFLFYSFHRIFRLEETWTWHRVRTAAAVIFGAQRPMQSAILDQTYFLG